MKTFRFLPVFLVVFLPIATSSIALGQEQKMDWLDMFFGEDNRRYHDMSQRTTMKAQWNGKATRLSIQPLFEDSGFRDAMGFTEEQIQQLDFMTSKGGSMGHWFQTKKLGDPKLKKMLEEAAEIQEGDHHMLHITPEQRERYHELLEEMTDYYYEETQKDFEKVLTPEQLQSVHETEIALLSEMGMVNPAMFEALDLTEEQRAELEEIKKEMETEFEALIEDSVAVQNATKDILYESLKNGEITSYEELEKSLETASENPENKKKIEKTRLEHVDKGRQFMSRFKVKMLDVLSDAQLEKMQTLIEQPPKYLADYLKKIQAQRDAMKKAGHFNPGPDAWEPGDPIPEEYLEKRLPGRFPKKK